MQTYSETLRMVPRPSKWLNKRAICSQCANLADAGVKHTWGVDRRITSANKVCIVI